MTSEVFTEAAAKGETDLSVINRARRVLDERFGPATRDGEFVALHLADLDTSEMAKLLGYRREAATVGLRRALSRSVEGEELAPMVPSREFVERLLNETRVARERPRRWRRAVAVIVSVVALLVVVPAVAALVAGHDYAQQPTAAPRSGTPVQREQPRTLGRARKGVFRRAEEPKARSTPARRASAPASEPSAPSIDAPVRPAARPPAPQQVTRCRAQTETLDAVYVGHARAQEKLMRRQAREKERFLRTIILPSTGPIPARLATVRRQQSALEARHTREQEALLERQNGELRRLEAQSCKR